MNLKELVDMTKLYTRDSKGYMFSSANVKIFINQAIDRMKQSTIFKEMKHLDEDSAVPSVLPEHYHYLLALFASSRLYDMDERFFEGTQKRNEFEQSFHDLISDIEIGIEKIDGLDTSDIDVGLDYVKDVYFNTTGGDN